MNPQSAIYLPTRVFLVLLRLAIGWHFLYEGFTKWETHRPDYPGPRWSAEGYLSNANGPFGVYYRRLLDDPDGVARLALANTEAKEPEKWLAPALVEQWEHQVAAFVTHHQLDDKQKQAALGKLDAIKRTAGDGIKRNREFIRDYLAAAEKYRADEHRRLAGFERDRLYSDRLRGLQTQRSFLMARIAQWNAELHASLQLVLKPEQKDQKRPPEPTLTELRRYGEWLHEWEAIDWVNFATIYGLIAMGAGLMLGLFTRLAAFGAAVFLASLYLAMPPWPGLPGTEAMGGHYLFVNLQIIELLAVLAVAGSGRWAGVDALIHAALFRRREKPALANAFPPPKAGT